MPINYVTSDKLSFTDKWEAAAHERILECRRLKWFNERYSIKGQLLYFFFKKEPVKPYDFPTI